MRIKLDECNFLGSLEKKASQEGRCDQLGWMLGRIWVKCAWKNESGSGKMEVIGDLKESCWGLRDRDRSPMGVVEERIECEERVSVYIQLFLGILL